MSGLFIGYARVSTEEQDLTAQRNGLTELGVEVERIYVDHGLTGTNRDRPGLREALAACRAGATLVVTKLDRLARSLPDARAIAEDLTKRKVRLSLGGSVYDPTDPVGRLLFNVLAVVAEFEADLIRSRTREGMRVAKAKGHLRGKQPKLNPRQEAHLVELLGSGEHTTAEVGDLFGVARSTVYRAVERSKRPKTGARPGVGGARASAATTAKKAASPAGPCASTKTRAPESAVITYRRGTVRPGHRTLRRGPTSARPTPGGGSACGHRSPTRPTAVKIERTLLDDRRNERAVRVGFEHAGWVMPKNEVWSVDADVDRVDWVQAKADLASDNFDNGRTPEALRRSFQQSPHVAFAWRGGKLVGMARMLSDGVCNAYLIDVWTTSSMRRRGVATAMVGRLKDAVTGQHIGLQTEDSLQFYTGLGFRQQPEFLSLVAGRWLDNDANR